MATRKPDAEVGPLGVWAYDTARLLGLSAEQVAQRAGVTEPTIRKIEGGSNRNPSKRVVYEMARYFREVAAHQGVAITDPPSAHMAASGAGTTTPDVAALISRIDDLVALVNRLVDQNAALISPSEPAVPPDVLEELDAAERERRESASRRRRSGPSPVEQQQSGVHAAR